MASNQYLPKKASDLQKQLGLIPHPDGGFFLETFRSGAVPMASRGQTDFDVPAHDLVETPERKDLRPDHDTRRNCLTSIYWVPTKESPQLPLIVNKSDHVHYYQGGKPFEYMLYDPNAREFYIQILGPDLAHGHSLQIPVKGGVWKCGKLLDEALPEIEADYCIVAEAVAPGFDVHDFAPIKEEQLIELTPEQRELVLPHLARQANLSEQEKNQDFDKHYS
jgi:predicted cupin superfamily sugar epimerase